MAQAAHNVSDTAPAPVLSVEGLTIGFRHAQAIQPVLRDVSFAVRPGTTLAVVGESGSGKTTLAQAVAGLLPAHGVITGGRILFTARQQQTINLASIAPRGAQFRALRGQRIAMVFQEPAASLAPVYTIGNLLAEALLVHEVVDRATARARAMDMLARVGFARPKEALDLYPFELSGGLRQRAMIAAALMCKPDLLIADEPTSALDVTVQAMLLKLLGDLQDQMGMSMMLITHDLGVVATIAEDMAVLYRGQVMERGPARDLLRSPEHPYLKALIKAAPRLSGKVAERLEPLRPIAAPAEELKKHWGHQLRPAEKGAPLLTVSDLVKRFAPRANAFGASVEGATGALAVNHVSFTIRRGESFGLVGESGCGKTTLCRMIMRALRADSGALFLDDEDGRIAVGDAEGTQLKAYRRKVQFVFQDPFGSLNPRHTAGAILSEPFEVHRIGTPKTRAAWAQELMQLVGLDPAMTGRYPNAFSGGQRQRIAIARALALKPDLLVCDEPVSALDVSIQAQIINLLADLKRDLGLTLLFVSHNLAVVRHIAERVAVMCRGRIVEMAPAEAIFADARHPYTKALLAAAPEPDPDARIDLKALLDGRASEPEAWDPPFRLAGDVQCAYETVGPDHIVAVAREHKA